MGRTVTLAEMQAARERVAQRLAPLVEELDPVVLLSAVIQVSGAMLARHWSQGVRAVPLGAQLDSAHGLLRCAFDDELLRMRRNFPAPGGARMNEKQAVFVTALAFLAALAGMTLAPRTTPEAERAQRVTPPWLTLERH